MLSSFVRFSLAIALVAAGVSTPGCKPREEIAEYTVRKPHLIDPKAAPVSSTAEGQEQQTLGAIVIGGETGWFFKLTGEPAAVESQREAFTAFVKSLKFSAGAESNPSWTLPEGWQELPGTGMRFATLVIQAEGQPLELSVIPLPQGEATKEEFLLANVNRWRDQVSLPPLSTQELAEETETIEIGDREATIVSVVGRTQSGGMGGAPFAPFAGGAIPSSAPGSSPTTPTGPPQQAPSPLIYEKPAGWREGQLNAFRKAAFVVEEGKKRIDITVIDLDAGSGDLLANVNRWRDQVGLPDTTPAELRKEAKPIETLGVQADYVELVGPSGGIQPQATILGVVANARERMWFVKLSGDDELAQREQANFEKFVKSLKFKE